MIRVRSSMELITQYANRRAELEDRIQSLEGEHSLLIADISALKERLTTLELERHAASLSTEVEALRTEKAVLEEKIATFSNPISSSGESYKI